MRLASTRSLVLCLAVVLTGIAATPAVAATAYAVNSSNQLLTFDTAAPGTILAQVSITGLQAGEAILGIDIRPFGGQLFALGSTSRLYTINPVTGAATQVGSAGAFTLSGTDFGFDFNPTVDRIRVTSEADQNLRLNPNTGALAATDTALAYAPGDTNAGANPNVVASAYTNNFAGSTTTTLYDIDSNLDILVTQNPPNNGTLNTVGALGLNTTGAVGFDILYSGGINTAFAALNPAATTTSGLYTINLTTGAATLIGTIGGGSVITGLAIVQPVAPSAYAVINANFLFGFSTANPSFVTTTIPITGLQGGESILGIDFRPATGQLYALGSTSRLYVINTSTGAATQVGSAGAFTLSGTSFGFDFNPTVDRIRVTSDSNENLRLNPIDGTLTATDTPLAYAAADPNAGADPNVVGSAYSNNFPGATTTTLYGIDSNLDIMTTQNPPNNGTLNTVGALGVDTGALVAFDAIFDGSSTIAFALLNVGGTPSLVSINLATGAATLIGAIPTLIPVTGLAVQQNGPDLTVTKVLNGGLTAGQSGATYTVTVRNAGNLPTAGVVTLTDTLPAELTATAISGSGWTCTLATLTCTRSDALASGASYPTITLTVDVSPAASGTLTTSVTVSGGGQAITQNDTATALAPVAAGADLTISKTDSGSFVQGQTGAQYTITVTNAGSGASSGTVTVTDTLPAGLTATALTGTGWSCNLGTLTCTRSDSLLGGASYPPLTLTVNVSAAAPSSVTNTADVSGGGDVNTANNSASVLTPVTALPLLSISKTHSGDFIAGSVGGYSIIVSNLGAGPTFGTVTVVDTLPAGLTAASMSGTGWSCSVATLTCTRSDALAPGASYPPITLGVNIAASASGTLVNAATVSGGGAAASSSASDTAVLSVAVPTVTEWGLILLALGLALVAFRGLRLG